MKNINIKSKGEQLFILLLLSTTLLVLFCTSGCGGKSCETIKCGAWSEDGDHIVGLSIPGPGGCLDSGKGCDSCLWAQSCKYVGGCITENSEIMHEEQKTALHAIDIRYYGDGCLGCGQSEKSFYTGCIAVDDTAKGLFYGNDNDGVYVIGCVDGCAGCFSVGDVIPWYISAFETVTEVN